MSVEDKLLARELMRELSRHRNLDISDVKVSCSRGIGYIAGVIRGAPGEFIDPKVEAKAIAEGARRVNGMKDVQIDAKFEISHKK